MRSEAIRTNPASWLSLLLAALLLLVANGRHTIPIAAWLSLLFLLRFVRVQPKRIGLPVAWLVLTLTWAFQLRGMAPLPGVFYYILSAAYGLVLVVPLVIDRLLAPRLSGLLSTLVLPTAWAAMEWCMATTTPYGSWSSLAYTQHENLVLMQLTAVTGIYGLSFLIAWFAAVGNLVWQEGTEESPVRRTAGVFAAVMAVVLLGGGARLTLFPVDAPTVRVASLTVMDYDPYAGTDGSAVGGLPEELTDSDREALRSNAHMVLDDFLERARREVDAGARIIFWGEANGFCLKEHEPEILARGAEFAREHRVYLGLSPAVVNVGAERPFENKIILVDPEGKVSYEYWKGIPVPGPEAAIQAVDGGVIRNVDTPHGRVGSAICFDMDFPGYLQEAGRLEIDLMLVPSNDWREIDPWHTHMARFRAVEQGFNLVRHVSRGFSVATDYQGRILGSMDHYVTEDRNLVAHVPTRGVRTFYARVGDLFSWICLAGLSGLAFGAIRQR
ncbi:MAG: hypothetical protein GY838_00460 [bacterium]|nr:hypothetical protein [bacterium]